MIRQKAAAMSAQHPPSKAEQPNTGRPGVSLHLGGLAEGTQILTAKGLVAVDDIQAGDRLVTRERGMQRVAFVTQRLLPSGEVLRIKPHALGGSAKDAPLIVAPSQRVLLRDWRAKAMFGRSIALVQARKLADGELIARRPARNLRLYSIHFDAELVIYAGGIEVGSATPVTAFLKS